MKHYLGIDPGLTGAAALMDANGGLIKVVDLPVIRDGALAWIEPSSDWLMWDCEPPNPEAWIERVSAMPGQGVASTFKFGLTVGSILAALRWRGLSINFVTPSKWKTALGLSKDKHASLDKARLLYPTAELDLVKHHGRAEAILIAHWARTCSWKAPQ